MRAQKELAASVALRKAVDAAAMQIAMPAFALGTRIYYIDRVYVFAGEVRVETHFVESGQGIGKTWKLVELAAPALTEEQE